MIRARRVYEQTVLFPASIRLEINITSQKITLILRDNFEQYRVDALRNDTKNSRKCAVKKDAHLLMIWVSFAHALQDIDMNVHGRCIVRNFLGCVYEVRYLEQRL